MAISYGAMHSLQPVAYILLFGASFIAGAINAVAGGGTLLTFPSLLAAGVPPVVANATSTFSLVPGSLAGAFSFRKELPELGGTLKVFAGPAVVGGLVGAQLLLLGGDKTLAVLVPWLILGASLLFVLQEPIGRRLNSQSKEGATIEASHTPAVVVFIFLVAIYGGYFGAGIGILTLAALGFLGMTNIHQMNGVKNILAASINVVATITFVVAGQVDWPIAATMSSGAVLGGFSGATLALKLGQKRVRQLITAIGFTIAAVMFWRQWH